MPPRTTTTAGATFYFVPNSGAMTASTTYAYGHESPYIINDSVEIVFGHAIESGEHEDSGLTFDDMVKE